MTRSQLLALMAQTHEEWEHALNFVGSRRLGIGGVSGRWSVRDMLAQLLMREQYLADRLYEILEQGVPRRPCQTETELDEFYATFGYPDYESPLLSEAEADEWAARKLRSIPLVELVELELRAYEAIYEAVLALGEEHMRRYRLNERILRHTVDRYRRYTLEIRARFRTPLRP